MPTASISRDLKLDLESVIDALAVRVADILSERDSAPEPTSPWMTTDEVAAYCKLTPEAVRQSEKRGKLRAHRSDTGRVRYLKADVDSFMRGAA